MLPEPFQVMEKVASAFNRLGIVYFIGGSLASSIYGAPRATQDVDLVADLRREQVDAFVAALQPGFYVDEEMILDALARRSSFNVIHKETMLKVDVFIPADTAWAAKELSRRRPETIGQGEESVELIFASAEDTLLHKLWWYREGGEVSDRQWRDVQNIIKIQGDLLDHEYLDKWAHEAGVHDLLDRAFKEAKNR